jgi:hypothetical protein
VQNQLAQFRPGTSATSATSATAAATAPTVTARPAPKPDPAELIKQRLNQPEIRMLTAARTVESRHGAFIATLKLAPQNEKMLKERIKEVLLRDYEMSDKVAKGEMSKEQVQASWDSSDEIRKIMADYTTPEQQAAFAEFQAQIPAREKQQARDQMKGVTLMMLNAQAPGLTEQSKNMVASLFADAMTNAAAPASPGADPNPTVRRYQAVEAQLQGKLPDDQMKIAKDYLQQQIQQTRAYAPAR